MVSIVSRPSITIPGSPVNVLARYTAAYNPIIYIFNITAIPDPTYVLVINVYEYGSNVLLASLAAKPQGIGNMRVDLQRYIQSYLSSNFGPDFANGINCAESGSVLRFYITYQEQWYAGGTPIVYDNANYTNASLSVKQIGDDNGQNMFDYVPCGQDGILAKFLTKFDTPVKWNNWPFTLSFIYSEDVINHDIYKIENSYDINMNELSDTETQLDGSQANFINWLKVSDNVASPVAYIGVKLRTGNVNPDSYVYEGYVTDGYMEVR